MADSGLPTGNGSIPSPAQLALAMAIVKQKPADLDIKDYIFQIRSFIATAKEPHPVSSPEKFFDSVSFWQKAYEKSEAEQSKLLDRIFELEQRNMALLTKSQTANMGGDEKTSESSKRKANNPKNAGGAATARKRAKTQAPALATGIQDGNINILDMMEFKEERTGPFMRQFYTLQKVLQKRPNRSSIVQAAVDLSTTAARNLLESVQEKKPAGSRSTAIIVLQTKDPEIGSVIHNVENAIELLYQGLAKLCATEGAASDIGKVSYHIVRLYDAAMNMLEQYCMVRAEKMLAPLKPNAKSKRKQSTKPQHPELKPDDEVASQITRLLGTMTLSLDLIYEEHQELMQGALYFLMNRVGRLLCLFVFQDLQVRPDLRIDSSKLPPPKGLKDISVNEKSLCAAKLEAKYLIWVLERILAYLNTTPPSPKTQAFTAKIKESLQGTLLQAVFGTDDGCYQKSLKMPTVDMAELARLRACAKMPEQAVPDWFVQEVWRLLGWEMLMINGQISMSHDCFSY